MNWTSTLQQLMEIQEAYKIQKVYELDKENVSEEGTWDHTGKNTDPEKYDRNLTVKKMLEFMKELDLLTQEKTNL